MIGSNLCRVLPVLAANCWFYQAVPKYGGIIPLAVFVNGGIMQQFVLELLIIPTTVLAKAGRIYIRLFLKICGYKNQSVNAVYGCNRCLF